MAIKALQNRQVKPPVVGRLWKGSPKKKVFSKKRNEEVMVVGDDLNDRFRFTSNINGAVDDFYSLFEGHIINEVPFFFPFDEFDNNFEAWCEAYTSSRLMHRCDGEHVVLYYDKASGTYKTPDMGTVRCKGGCDWVARLSLVVPAFLPKHPGVVSLHLKGKNEIVRLNAELQFYEQSRGSLKGINFLLYRYPKMISTPGGRVQKWLVGIRPDSSLMTMLIQGSEDAPALAGGNGTMQLESGVTVDSDGVVVEEPEMIEGEVVEDEPVVQIEKREPPRKPRRPAKSDGTNYKSLARAGNWVGAISGIPRYANEFPKFMGATQKLVRGGINNQGLTRGDDAPDLRVDLFVAMKAYATARDNGNGEFDALVSVHSIIKSSPSKLVDILEPLVTAEFDNIPSATTESTGTQPALIGEVEAAQQNAQLI